MALWTLVLMGMRVLLMFLLAEDLQLKEELLLLKQPSVGGVHGWRRRFFCLLVWWDILVVLELLHFGFDIFGLFVAVLVGHFGLLC